MTYSKDKLLDRIRKLLALGTSSNENEAARAMEKAQALLIEHNLSMAEVAIEERPDDDIIVDELDEKTDSVPWIRPLASAVAQLYFCRYFYTHQYDSRPNSRKAGAYKRRDRHSFVGAAHNTAVVKLMFTYLIATVDRLAREGARNVAQYEKSSYMTSFKSACVSRLSTRIMQRIAAAKAGTLKTESGNTLPAVIYDDLLKRADDFLKSNYKNMKSSKQRSTMNNYKGISDGYAAGEKISLDGQLGNKSETRGLLR